MCVLAEVNDRVAVPMHARLRRRTVDRWRGARVGIGDEQGDQVLRVRTRAPRSFVDECDLQWRRCQTRIDAPRSPLMIGAVARSGTERDASRANYRCQRRTNRVRRGRSRWQELAPALRVNTPKYKFRCRCVGVDDQQRREGWTGVIAACRVRFAGSAR